MALLARLFEILFVWSTRLVAFGLVSCLLFVFGLLLIACVSPSLSPSVAHLLSQLPLITVYRSANHQLLLFAPSRPVVGLVICAYTAGWLLSTPPGRALRWYLADLFKCVLSRPICAHSTSSQPLSIHECTLERPGPRPRFFSNSRPTPALCTDSIVPCARFCIDNTTLYRLETT